MAAAKRFLLTGVTVRDPKSGEPLFLAEGTQVPNDLAKAIDSSLTATAKQLEEAAAATESAVVAPAATESAEPADDATSPAEAETIKDSADTFDDE